MHDSAAAPRTVRLRTLFLAAGAILVLAVVWFGYRVWSERARIAANRALLDLVYVQKRQFAPGELVDQSATGAKVRVLSCTAGGGGMQDKCLVADEGDVRPGEAVMSYPVPAWQISLRENDARTAKGLPLLSGRRSDAALAPMLATWTPASRAVANATPPTNADTAPATLPASTVPAPPGGTVPPPPAAARAGDGTLPDGEYACYGSGSTVLAGLGFKASSGSYTDLDGRERGTVAVRGTDVVFTGGHLDGQTGHELKSSGFRIGAMAVCEKW